MPVVGGTLPAPPHGHSTRGPQKLPLKGRPGRPESTTSVSISSQPRAKSAPASTQVRVFTPKEPRWLTDGGDSSGLKRKCFDLVIQSRKIREYAKTCSEPSFFDVKKRFELDRLREQKP